MTSGRADRNPPTAHAMRGQSMVEFSLVLPLLLMLLLGIADFGRVFATAITVEAAARNGAEAAAQEYVQLRRNQPGGTLSSSDYATLHRVALAAVCDDAERLPDRVSDGTTCTMPSAAVCVFSDDQADPHCGTEASSAPAQCTRTTAGWTAAFPPVTDPLPYVEVRVCYRFRTLFNLSGLSLPFGAGLSLGDVWIERSRSFVAGAY